MCICVHEWSLEEDIGWPALLLFALLLFLFIIFKIYFLHQPQFSFPPFKGVKKASHGNHQSLAHRQGQAPPLLDQG